MASASSRVDDTSDRAKKDDKGADTLSDRLDGVGAAIGLVGTSIVDVCIQLCKRTG